MAQLGKLDRVKPALLKRVLGLHTSCCKRLVYLLADTHLFVESSETAAYREFIQQWEEKMAEANPDFFSSGAMTNDVWKGLNRSNRLVVVRYAVQGFTM